MATTKNSGLTVLMVEPANADERRFVREVSNIFTCENLGGMVQEWQELLEGTDEENRGTLEEHAAWERVAKGILKWARANELPLHIDLADTAWKDAANLKLDRLYEGKPRRRR